MRLVHWSHKKVTKVQGRRQWSLDDDRHGRRSLPGKPNGFWLSDETRGAYGWRAWCRAERFRPYGFRYEHEVKLVPNAKILYLRTPQEIDSFTHEYGYSLLDEHDKREGKVPFSKRIGYGRYGQPYYDSIDWKRVAKKYHGIVITPYQWSRRLDGGCQWYYSWDCASGCIWNARAIESITMVKEHKAPRKPTLKEERRKHKRIMIKMREATQELLKSSD